MINSSILYTSDIELIGLQIDSLLLGPSLKRDVTLAGFQASTTELSGMDSLKIMVKHSVILYATSLRKQG